VYESNGPDVKIRGTASHVAEKYIQLARDSQTSGDPVAAENYYQHAEHYFRMIAAAQDQFRQQGQPSFYRPEGGQQGGDDSYDDDVDEQQGQPGEPGYGSREQPSYQQRDSGQPYQQQPRDNQQQQHRDHQPYQGRDNNQPYQGRDQQQPAPRPQHQPNGPQPNGPAAETQGDVGGLPSFITGGGQPQPPQPAYGQNGHDNNQPDRFPLHRRRRRHRGPRNEIQGGGGQQGSGGGDDTPRPTND
jgi:hypothetical protein